MSVPTEWRLKEESYWTPISEDLNKTQIGDSFRSILSSALITCNACGESTRLELLIRVLIDDSEGTVLNYHLDHLPEKYKNRIEFR